MVSKTDCLVRDFQVELEIFNGAVFLLFIVFRVTKLVYYLVG